MTDLPVRDTARALVLDPLDRDPGETHEEALRRELDEEIGRGDAPVGPWVGRREAPFLLFKKQRFVRERYYLVRLPDDRIDTARLAETEDNPVLGVRWWPLAELERALAVVEPRGVIDLVARILAGRAPAVPVPLA